MTAVFKGKGSKTEAGSYRPISLTSLVCRVMESLLKDAIVEHLQNHHLIKPSQHGFVPHKSCLTNLLEFLEEITKIIDEGHSIDMVYLDFAKAFDKVPHMRLMAKVRAHGIDGVVAKWVEEWLHGRKQRVVLNGHQSDWADVTSGVPQGSVLGPCLFVLYINDIDNAVDVVKVIMKKFADDTKAGRIINTPEDRDRFQEDLNNLFKWAEEWQMLFNIGKCKVMHLGNKNSLYKYHMNGVELEVTDKEKDVGVYILPSLKPSVQVAKAAKKANQVLGQLLRTFTFRDKVHFVQLYVQRVRCLMEYAVQSWNPWLKQDIDLLEDVQRRAVRSISGLNGTYEEKLKKVGLTTLEERRHRGDMIQTFKMINKIDDMDPAQFFTFTGQTANHATRQAVTVEGDPLDGVLRHKHSLNHPVARLDIRRYSFSSRVVSGWNSLPSYVTEATSVNNFKNLYDTHKSMNSVPPS